MRRAAVITAIVSGAVAIAVPALATHHFSDVPHDHPHAEGIEWAAEQGLVQGREDGTYGPEEPVKRGQLATVLERQRAYRGPVYTLTPDCGDLTMVVFDHQGRGSGAASVQYSVDGGDRITLPAIPPDEPLEFEAAASGVVSLFVDGIAWAHAPTGETCDPDSETA